MSLMIAKHHKATKVCNVIKGWLFFIFHSREDAWCISAEQRHTSVTYTITHICFLDPARLTAVRQIGQRRVSSPAAQDVFQGLWARTPWLRSHAGLLVLSALLLSRQVRTRCDLTHPRCRVGSPHAPHFQAFQGKV